MTDDSEDQDLAYTDPDVPDLIMAAMRTLENTSDGVLAVWELHQILDKILGEHEGNASLTLASIARVAGFMVKQMCLEGIPKGANPRVILKATNDYYKDQLDSGALSREPYSVSGFGPVAEQTPGLLLACLHHDTADQTARSMSIAEMMQQPTAIVAVASVSTIIIKDLCKRAGFDPESELNEYARHMGN
jgi:hypothetical protein